MPVLWGVVTPQVGGTGALPLTFFSYLLPSYLLASIYKSETGYQASQQQAGHHALAACYNHCRPTGKLNSLCVTISGRRDSTRRPEVHVWPLLLDEDNRSRCGPQRVRHGSLSMPVAPNLLLYALTCHAKSSAAGALHQTVFLPLILALRDPPAPPNLNIYLFIYLYNINKFEYQHACQRCLGIHLWLGLSWFEQLHTYSRL